jgi:hypothetical protein
VRSTGIASGVPSTGRAHPGEVTATAELLEVLPQLKLPVARTSHLIALKVLSRDDVRRPTDLAAYLGLKPTLLYKSASSPAGRHLSSLGCHPQVWANPIRISAHCIPGCAHGLRGCAHGLRGCAPPVPAFPLGW